MMWRNTLRGTVYTEVPYRGGIWSTARSEKTGKLTRVRSSHLEEFDRSQILRDMARDGQLAGMHELDPLEGEPAADPGEPDHVPDPLPAPPVLERAEPTPSDLPVPSLPVLHATLREAGYNIGSAIVMLAELEEHWPATSKVAAIRVAVLLLEDEIARITDRV